MGGKKKKIFLQHQNTFYNTPFQKNEKKKFFQKKLKVAQGGANKYGAGVGATLAPSAKFQLEVLRFVFKILCIKFGAVWTTRLALGACGVEVGANLRHIFAPLNPQIAG